jgi:hypothetical protein
MRCWVSVDMRKPLPAIVLHRNAKRLLARLAQVGEPIVFAFSDPRQPKADRWLRRLGFEIDVSVPGPAGWPVWSMRLADG